MTSTSPAITSGTLDTRTGGPKLGTEREVLDAWLEDYRLSLLLKLDGLDAEQLAARPLTTTSLSLLGILRHLTEVEGYWLREVLHGEDIPDLYCSQEFPDGDFDLGTARTAQADVERYHSCLGTVRTAASGWSDLDGPVAGLRHGEPLNLRWILTHLIEEYARHLGHADLLREALDGRTGY